MTKAHPVTKDKARKAVTKAQPVTKAKASIAVTKAHAVTKSTSSTVVRKTHAVTKAQNLINRPLSTLESPISAKNTRKYKIFNEATYFSNKDTYFKESTSTSHIPVLGDEGFIVLH